MHGDWDEPDASELGRTPFDWQAVLVVVLMVALFVFSFFAGGGCAQGAEPVFAAFPTAEPTWSAFPTQQPTAPVPVPVPITISLPPAECVGGT